MSFIGSTTTYPLTVPAPTDTVPFIKAGVLKQTLVSDLAAAVSGAELKGLTFTSDTGSTADADSSAGFFWWNNATQASATVLFFDNLTADAVATTTFFAALGTAGFIYVQQSDDSTKWQLWKWSAITAGSGYYKFTVTLMAINGAIADNKTVYTQFIPTLTRIGLPFEKEFALSDLTTAITTGTTKGYWRPAFAATGVSARTSLRVVSSSGLPTVDMNKNASTMMSTKLTIDVSELTSVTAATPVVMSSTTFAIDDLIEWDIDVAGTGAMGLIVTVTGIYAS